MLRNGMKENTQTPSNTPAPLHTTTAALVTWFKESKAIPRRLSSEQKFSAWSKALEDKELPTAIVDLNAFDRNVEKIKAAVKDTKQTIRIPVKSLRNPFLIKRILDQGHPFKGIMCRNASEAEFFCNLGINDILIAYPTTVHRPDVRKLRRMQANGADIVFALNQKEQMEVIAKHLAVIDKEEDGRLPPLNIVVDLDLSYKFLGSQRGPLRSPILTEEQLKTFLKEATNFPQFKVVGAIGYEGVIAGVQDDIPYPWYDLPDQAYNTMLRNMRTGAVPDIAARRVKVVDIFKDAKCEMKIFNGGGTGSIDSACKEVVLTELSPGSGALCPHLFNDYSNLNRSDSQFNFEAALYSPHVVVSHPNAATVTVAGGGYIASGATGVDKQPMPVFPANFALTKDEGAGETNTPLAALAGQISSSIRIGSFFQFRPAKVGDFLERVNSCLLAVEDEIVAEAPTYRGLGQNFG